MGGGAAVDNCLQPHRQWLTQTLEEGVEKKEDEEEIVDEEEDDTEDEEEIVVQCDEGFDSRSQDELQ